MFTYLFIIIVLLGVSGWLVYDKLRGGKNKRFK